MPNETSSEETRGTEAGGISPLEVFADGIMHREGWALGSRSWRNRNPGNLRPSAAGQPCDAQGYRRFPSLCDGYTALVRDITCKFTGNTRTGLGPASTIGQYFAIYAPARDGNDPGSYARYMAFWLAAGLGKQITIETRLREIWTL